MLKKYCILLFLFVFCSGLKSQVKDSVNSSADSSARVKANRKKIYGAPRRATIMSAVLPGLGQVYNRKYWKVPLIYAGIGGFAYMFSYNNNLYKSYKKDVIAYYDDDPSTTAVRPYSGDALQSQKLYYRKYRDYAIVGIGAVYLINLIDANVDAHLKTFDVSDNLSMNIRPWFQPQISGSAWGMVNGISIKLNFKR